VFPKIEDDYLTKLTEFEQGAAEYWKSSLKVSWELVDGRPVHVGADLSKINREFFDWRKIETPYREAVASHYQEKYPAFGVTAEPENLQLFFAANEFGFSTTDVTVEDGTKDIHNFALGAWPKFRDALIANNEREAAHLAAVIFEDTAQDWKPVGDRSMEDPMKFLHHLQSGKSVQSHVKFTLYRLQQ
jgi:hypothetical protein